MNPFAKVNFPDFLAALHSSDERYTCIERAAIMENCGRMSREEAERKTVEMFKENKEKP